MIALQAAAFPLRAPMYDKSMLLNVTAPGLRQQQESREGVLQAIRRFDPRTPAVSTLIDQDLYRCTTGLSTVSCKARRVRT